MHELPLFLSAVLSSGNLTFVVRTGLKRLWEKTEEVTSVFSFIDPSSVVFAAGGEWLWFWRESKSPWNILHCCGPSAGNEAQSWCSFQIKHWLKHLQILSSVFTSPPNLMLLYLFSWRPPEQCVNSDLITKHLQTTASKIKQFYKDGLCTNTTWLWFEKHHGLV